jgi:hypothetical protein
LDNKNQPRIDSLKLKHAAAEQRIEELQKSPAPCPSVMRGLKARKLQLKDEITELSKTPPPELSVVEGAPSDVSVATQAPQCDAAAA